MQCNCRRSWKSSVGRIVYYLTNQYSHLSQILRTHASSQFGQIMCQGIRIFPLGDNYRQKSGLTRQPRISSGTSSDFLQSHMPMLSNTKYPVPYLNKSVTKITSQRGRGQYLEFGVYLSPHQKVMA